MIDQALTDSVDIRDIDGFTLQEDVPAYVYTQQSITPTTPDGAHPYRLIEELRAILPPHIEFDRINDVIHWRGHDYHPDSDAMWSRQHGLDHHQVVVLKRTEG